VSLLRQGKALALTIYLGESDQWQGMPLYVAVWLGDWLGQWLISKTRRTARRSMTTRTLALTLAAHPPEETGSSDHLDVQDDLLLPERRDEQETRHRRS